MRKNLLSVIIIALLVVNIVMTAFMMFTVIPANKKTVALVGDVAAAMNLELSDPSIMAGATVGVSVEDTVTYDIADQMTISLRRGDDGKDHYAMCSVSFSINTQHEDYKTYQPMLAAKESKIKSEIIEVVGQYTKEEAQANVHGIEEAILAKVQAMFDSTFVYEAYFRDIKFQ